MSEPRVHLLHPGDVACAARGETLQTLLGSCIAVLLTDPRRSVGAMCHIVHAGPAPHPADTAWAMPAIDAMARLLLERGLQAAYCQAWVYGGGNMFPGLYAGRHVGLRNAEVVLARLAADGIRLLHHDTGGSAWRRLRWTVGDGEPQVDAVDVAAQAGPM